MSHANNTIGIQIDGDAIACITLNRAEARAAALRIEAMLRHLPTGP